MSDENATFKERVISAYENSRLFEANKEAREAESMALYLFLENLGYGYFEKSNIVEIEGVFLIAKYGGFDLPRYTRDIEAEGVAIRAHVKCDLCGEMRHSETFTFDNTGYLGQFLSEHHNCAPKPEIRRIGLRPETP